MKNRFDCNGLVLRGLFLVCAIATTPGCGRRVDRNSTEVDPAQSAAAVAPVATALAAKLVAEPALANDAATPKHGEGPGEESCGVDHSQKIRDSGERVVKDPKTGKETTQVGQPLGQGAQRTKLTALQKAPEPLVGKTIAVEGDVVAMCSHRRGWFAVVDETSKTPLRIVAVPNFLVPSNAMGKRAKAVGVLEVQEVSEQAAKHLSQDHGLPEARRIVTLRATGAEFF